MKCKIYKNNTCGLFLKINVSYIYVSDYLIIYFILEKWWVFHSFSIRNIFFIVFSKYLREILCQWRTNSLRSVFHQKLAFFKGFLCFSLKFNNIFFIFVKLFKIVLFFSFAVWYLEISYEIKKKCLEESNMFFLSS